MKKQNQAMKIDGLKFSTYILYLASAILLIFSVYMWNRFVAGSDGRVFWRAIDKALSSEGVQVTIDDSNDELTQRVVVTLDSAGDLSAEARNEIVSSTNNSIIRTLSSKSKDYLYYEKNDNSQIPALKELEGTWVDISLEGQTESKTLADQFTSASVIFTGNLSTSDRKSFVRMLQDDQVYSIQAVRGSEKVFGESARIYSIQISSVGFNKALQRYLELIDLPTAASQVDALNATNELKPEVLIAVSESTGEVVATGYPNFDSIGARQYTGWGRTYEFDFPDSAISSLELQERIDAIYTR